MPALPACLPHFAYRPDGRWLARSRCKGIARRIFFLILILLLVVPPPAPARASQVVCVHAQVFPSFKAPAPVHIATFDGTFEAMVATELADQFQDGQDYLITNPQVNQGELVGYSALEPAADCSTSSGAQATEPPSSSSNTTLCGLAMAYPSNTGALFLHFVASDGTDYGLDIEFQVQFQPDRYYMLYAPMIQNNMIVRASSMAEVASCGGASAPAPTHTPTFPPPTWTPVIPTDTPWPTNTPIPPTATSTATPTSTPTPAGPPADFQALLDRKLGLASQMETLNLDTGWFTVPAVHAYNEDFARNLLSRLQTMAAAGTLTSDQVEGLRRLVLQENALHEILPQYTTIAGSLAGGGADTLKAVIGIGQALTPVWQVCDGLVYFCPALHQKVDAIFGRLLNKVGDYAFEATDLSPEQKEAGSKAFRLTVSLIEAGVSGPDGLKEILTDSTVQAGATGLMIQPYLAHTQPLIEQGVRSALQDTAGGPVWPITGSTKIAELNMQELTRSAGWEADDARQRYATFQKAASLADTAADIADLGRIPPQLSALAGGVAWIAKVTSVGARLEQMAVNLVGMGLNTHNLQCVQYFSDRAAEMAFKADQPSENCRYRQGLAPAGRGLQLAPHPAPHPSRLASSLAADSSQYKGALGKLTAGVASGNPDTIAAAVDEVNQAYEGLAGDMDQAQAVLLSRASLSASEQAVLTEGIALDLSQVGVLLNTAEMALAAKANQPGQADLGAAVDAAARHADALGQYASQVDLNPPAGKALLLLKNVNATVEADKVTIKGFVLNVGGAESGQISLRYLLDEPVEAPAVPGFTLQPGRFYSFSVTLDKPQASSVGVEVFDQGALKASAQALLPRLVQPVPPAGETQVAALPVATALPAPAGPAVPVAVLINFVLGGVIVVLVGLLAVSNRRRPR